MDSRFFLALLIPCLVVAACGREWTKPGATTNQINSAIEACKQVAAEQFPVAMSSTDTSNQKEYETHCTSHGNQTNCTTRSSDIGGSYQYDRNQEERQRAISQCLESRGYKR